MKLVIGIFIICFALLGCSVTSNSKEDAEISLRVLKTACNELATSYPFVEDGPYEVSVETFDRYFGPNGLVQQYENLLELSLIHI